MRDDLGPSLGLRIPRVSCEGRLRRRIWAPCNSRSYLLSRKPGRPLESGRSLSPGKEAVQTY
eukprot:6353439-Pyramimonas_sp.AAC.1